MKNTAQERIGHGALAAAFRSNRKTHMTTDKTIDVDVIVDGQQVKIAISTRDVRDALKELQQCKPWGKAKTLVTQLRCDVTPLPEAKHEV